MRSSAWIWLFSSTQNTEHQRAVGRRQIEPDDVADLVHEVRITGELEGLAAMRLQAERTPDAPDRRVRQSGLLRHRAQRPVGGVGRGGAQRPLDHLGDPLVCESPWPSRPGFVRQALDAVLDEAAAPLPHGVLVHAELGRHRCCPSRPQSAGSCGTDPPSSAQSGAAEPDPPETTVPRRSRPAPPRGVPYHVASP